MKEYILDKAGPSVIGRHAAAPIVPETWAERGVVMPFTTPALAFARVRRPAHGEIEILVRAPDGTKGFYAVGLKALPSFVSPTLFDRSVLAMLRDCHDPLPTAAARAWRTSVARGFAGRRAALAEQTRQRRERAIMADMLTKALVRVTGRDEAEVVACRLDGPNTIFEFVSLNRALLDRAARDAGIGRDLFIVALGNLAQAMDRSAFVASTIEDIHHFIREAEALSPLNSSEATVVQFVTGAARRTADAAAALHDEFMRLIAVPRRAIRLAAQGGVDWRASLDRAIMVVDGWPFLLGLWRLRFDVSVQGMASLWTIGRCLPPLPAELRTALPDADVAATVHPTWPNTPVRLRQRHVGLTQEVMERVLEVLP